MINTIKGLEGKTISSAEHINAEYGRTYDTYILLTFTDGAKAWLYGGIPHAPDADIEEMKKAPNFFTAEDIADKILRMERYSRQKKKEQEDRARREYEELKKKFEPNA